MMSPQLPVFWFFSALLWQLCHGVNVVDMHLRLDFSDGGVSGMPMVAPHAQPVLTWEVPANVNPQERVSVFVRGPGLDYNTTTETSDQNATLALPPMQDATVYTVSVTIFVIPGIPLSSTPIKFFTALRTWDAAPVWAAACAASGNGGNGPTRLWLVPQLACRPETQSCPPSPSSPRRLQSPWCPRAGASTSSSKAPKS